jgi:polysaccharide biosynthesis/export protein
MRRNTYLYLFIIQAMILGLSSCVNQKKIAYFQKAPNQSDTIQVVQAYVPKIQPGDIIDVNIGSLNPIASSFFNPYSSTPVNTDNLSAESGANSAKTMNTSAPGFLVDSSGMIEIPVVGLVKVAGLNTSQARDLIKKRLTQYLKEPTVNVRFLNFKVSIMGEVVHPSVYIIPNERISLPEALSMAGDLTIYGRRDNILIVRDDNGKKEFARVDLSSREVFTSPYYYLHSGDLIYVEQAKQRIATGDIAYRIIPIVISTLTLLTLIYIRVK